MQKQIYIKQQPCVVSWGQFPTLVSNNPKVDGMLMSNKAHCYKAKNAAEKYQLQPKEKEVLKAVKKTAPKVKLVTIMKGSGLISNLV